MEAPEKLYFDTNDINGILSIYSDKEPNDTIEYVRKDVVIEKTCDFIRKMVDVTHNIECKDGQPLADDYIKYAEERLKAAEKVVEHFKKYLKL